MYDKATPGFLKNNQMFSTCSMERMIPVISKSMYFFIKANMRIYKVRTFYHCASLLFFFIIKNTMLLRLTNTKKIVQWRAVILKEAIALTLRKNNLLLLSRFANRIFSRI